MFPPFAPFFLLACSAGHWFLENEEKEKRKVKPMHYCRFLVVAKHDFLFLFTLSVCACECVCVIESMHTNVFVKKVCERLWGGHMCCWRSEDTLGNWFCPPVCAQGLSSAPGLCTHKCFYPCPSLLVHCCDKILMKSRLGEKGLF